MLVFSVPPLPRDPFTAGDARAAGYGPRQVREQLDAGRWVSLRRGVYCTAVRRGYALTEARFTHELDVLAAQLAVRRPSVASGWSAACLHGLPLPLSMAAYPPTVTLTTSIGRAGSPISGVCLHTGPLDDQVVLVSGIRTTSPDRTAVDTARWADRLGDAVAVCDAVLRRGDVTKYQLDALLARFRSWPGVARARRAIELADPRAESPLESHSRVMFAEQDLPAPESQVEIVEGDRVIARVDFLWREMSTIGEADGRLKYSIGEAVYREKRREDRLRELGFEVVRWDFSDLRFNPRAAADRIRAAFRRGRGQLRMR